MRFSFKTSSILLLKICWAAVPKFTNLKNSGLEFDNMFTSDLHIEKIGKKIMQQVSVIDLISHYLSKDTILNYYQVYNKPSILYGPIKYGCTYKTNSLTILNVQKKTV